MNNQEIRIPDEIASEVLTLAARHYADMTQSYSASELVEAGKAVDLPPDLIKRAIQEVQNKHEQEQQRQEQIAKQKKNIVRSCEGILVCVFLGMLWSYNVLTTADSQTEAAWAQVENQLQRRADLIPNLVSVTRSYAQQEKDLVILLLNARSAYSQARNSEEKTVAIAKIDRAIQHFQDYSMTHPVLQSNQLFINLQYELTGTENRLAVERMRYNQAVSSYNQKIVKIPHIFIAKVLRFQKKPFFQASSYASSDLKAIPNPQDRNRDR